MGGVRAIYVARGEPGDQAVSDQMSSKSIENYIIKDHARFEMERRGIIDRDPAEVVTVYRTSKIEKYWR